MVLRHINSSWWFNPKSCFYIYIKSYVNRNVNIFYREGIYVNIYIKSNVNIYINILDGTPLKLVDKFTYLGSSVASTEKDIDTRLTKAWRAINRLSIIWKSDLTDKMKGSLFQAAVTSILLYGCTTWTLTKRLEKKLDGNYTRMLRAISNKSWRQHPTRHQQYGHLPPITKTIQVRRTRHAGHCWRSRDELISDVLLWTTHMAVQKQDDQHEHIFSNYVRIQDVVQKTCLRRWTRGKSGERGSGISVLPAWHDDDDILNHMYVNIYIKSFVNIYVNIFYRETLLDNQIIPYPTIKFNIRQQS